MYTYLTDWSKLVHGYVIRRIDKLRGMIVYVFHVDRHRQVRRNLRAKTLKCAARATASSLYPSNITRHSSTRCLYFSYSIISGSAYRVIRDRNESIIAAGHEKGIYTRAVSFIAASFQG